MKTIFEVLNFSERNHFVIFKGLTRGIVYHDIEILDADLIVEILGR